VGRKALCQTSIDCLAHVHGDVEVGDHIFDARGATVPFIVRSTENDETFSEAKNSLGISTFYKLMGGSYIHGIMDEELSGMVDAVKFKEEPVYLI
jgi:hypothetical protein